MTKKKLNNCCKKVESSFFRVNVNERQFYFIELREIMAN